MIIKQKTNQKRVRLLLAILLSFLIVGSLAYLAFASQNGNSPLGVFDNSGSKTDSSDTKDSSEQGSPDPEQKLTPTNTDHSTVSPVDESTGKQTIPVVASANVDGSVVYIRGGLNVYRSTGLCFAKLTGPNGETIQKDTDLLPSAGTTDCRTIQIPVSELAPGEWTFTLNYSADDAVGASDASSFSI